MDITKYRTALNEDGRNILVAECISSWPEENLGSPEEITRMLNALYGFGKMAEEHMYMVAFTVKYRPLGVFEVSHGSVDCSIVSPRSIFIRLFLAGASCFVLAHNHPSGDCMPSKVDIETTEKIKQCADLMGIALIDHIIIGTDYYSFKTENMI